MLFVALWTFTVHAVYAETKQIPGYSKVAEVQFACSPNKFKELNFALGQGAGFASGILAVVKDLKIKETKAKKPTERVFDVSFIGFDQITCSENQKTDYVSLNKGEKYHTRILIAEAFKAPGKFQLWELHKNELDAESMLVSMNAIGGEAPPKGGGVNCLIDRDDFVSGKVKINQDLLCSGNSKAAKEATKHYIYEILKAARKN